MTFKEFIEINKKYGLSRMYTDNLEKITKEETIGRMVCDGKGTQKDSWIVLL